MQNIIVHHCVLENSWQDKLKGFLERIYSSKLYNRCSFYYLMITDLKDQKEELYKIIKPYDKVRVDYRTTELGEKYGLDKVYDIANYGPDSNILYIRNDAITNFHKNLVTKEISTEKVEANHSIIEMLQFYLIDKWETCLSYLNEGRSLIGVNEEEGILLGNWWWTRSDYVRTLQPFNFTTTDLTSIECERWIKYNKVKNKSLVDTLLFYEFNVDPFFSTFPKYLYNGSEKEKITWNIKKALYGYFPEIRNESFSLPSGTQQILDVTDLVNDYLNSNQINFSSILIDDRIDISEEIITANSSLEKKLKIYYSLDTDPERVEFFSSIPSLDYKKSVSIFL